MFEVTNCYVASPVPVYVSVLNYTILDCLLFMFQQMSIEWVRLLLIVFVEVIVLNWLLHYVDHCFNRHFLWDTVSIWELDSSFFFLCLLGFCVKNVDCTIFVDNQEFIHVLLLRDWLKPLDDLHSTTFLTRRFVEVVFGYFALTH